MPGYTMLIYLEDKEFIRKATLEYENIETGGDLFGLWQSESEVVVQLVTGPGIKCRRTVTAFYQDREYLSDVGNYLTSHKGLCNIGEWHSHHRLNLPRPSDGDKATVWRHMPDCGLKRFLLIIATITPNRQVDINGFMFTVSENGSRCAGMHPVDVRVLYGQNPFRHQHEVLSKLRQGAEMQDLILSSSEYNSPSSQSPNVRSSVETESKKKSKKSKASIKNPFRKNKSKNEEEKIRGKENKATESKPKQNIFGGKKKNKRRGYKGLKHDGGTSRSFSRLNDDPNSASAFDETNQSHNNVPQRTASVSHHGNKSEESEGKKNYSQNHNAQMTYL